MRRRRIKYDWTPVRLLTHAAAVRQATSDSSAAGLGETNLYESLQLPVAYNWLTRVTFKNKYCSFHTFVTLTPNFYWTFKSLYFFWNLPAYLPFIFFSKMSDTEEFQAVDVHDLEEEEALSDDEVIPELVDDPNQGEVALRPLMPLDRRGASKIRVGDEFHLRNNYDLFHRFSFTFRIQLPWRFMAVTSSFTSGCSWRDFGSRFQKLLGS
jgi:hypothetical protein